MITQTLDIATLSLEQIKSLTVAELKACCKALNLRGYSRLNKISLIDLVYRASDIERQSLINSESDRLNNSDRSIEAKKIKRRENALKEHPINIAIFNKLLRKGLNSETIANTVFKICSDNYADLTVAKNCTQRLNIVLPETNLSPKEQSEVKSHWRKLVYAINYARKEQENLLLKSYAREAIDTLDSRAIVDWAISNLTNDKYIIKGLALAVLSGRRMIEIYGDTQYQSFSVGIRAKGLAKKSDNQNDECIFIPLCDRTLWLKSLKSLESIGKRLLDKKQVNGSISKLTSRHFPKHLQELKVEKFKDCRDVYAAIVYQTFQLVARDSIPFTKAVMGHETQESTAYYRKFDCEPMTELQQIFKEYTLL